MGFKHSISVPGSKRAGEREPGELERQVGQRVFLDIEVDFGDQENFLFAYIRDLEATGIFVHTLSPEAPGTHVNVRFIPHDAHDAESPLALDGEVIWINPYRPNDSNNLSPGMGIRFLELTCEQRFKLIARIRRFAYLADDIRAEPTGTEPTGTEPRGTDSAAPTSGS